MRLRNLTSHPIAIYSDDDPSSGVVIAPEGRVKLVTDWLVDEYITYHNRLIPIYVSAFHQTDLPEPEPNTLLVVSGLISEIACREDVVSPARIRRDSLGHVNGARGFVRHYKEEWQ